MKCDYCGKECVSHDPVWLPPDLCLMCGGHPSRTRYRLRAENAKLRAVAEAARSVSGCIVRLVESLPEDAVLPTELAFDLYGLNRALAALAESEG